MTKKKLSILGNIETKSMSDSDRKIWEAIDEALGKSYEEIMTDETSGLKTSIIDALKGMDEFKPADVTNFINRKAFDEKVKDLEDAILAIKAKNEGEGIVKKNETIYDQVKRQLKAQGVLSSDGTSIDSDVMKSKGGNIKLNIKAATMSTGVANIVFGNEIDTVVSVDPRTQTIIRQVANVATIAGRQVTYSELVDVEGDAAWVPERGLKPSMTASLAEKTITAGKVALTAKISQETLRDLPQLVSEIEAELVSRIGIKEEEGLLSGSGTGGEIKGVLDSVPRFVLTGLEVSAPNKYDALVAAYTQIVSTSKMSYRPNMVLMNPVDFAQMQLTKDLNGQYLKPFNVVSELVQGLRIETSTAVKQGEFFMGDFTRLNIRDLVGMQLTIGWENDDFTRNLVTLINEKRMLVYIKSQYKTAFVFDTFDNVITGITD